MPSLDGSFPPSAIGEAQAKMLTHINYAFIGINDQYECDFTDAAQAESEAATIAQLQSLKSWNPELKILFSIGGWAESNDDSPKVANYRNAFTAENRQHLVDSCVAFMQEHEFDGIDIDWEYPRNEDVQNYIAGLTLFRTTLDARAENELLTIAGAASPYYLQRYYTALPEIVAQLDFINLMTYDYNGPWSGATNFHAHLFGASGEASVWNAISALDPAQPGNFKLTSDSAVKQHLLADIPREKIVMGVPFYGRAFFQVGTENNGLYQTFVTTGEEPYAGTDTLPGCGGCDERNDPRAATFAEIQDMIAGNMGYTRHFDEQTKAPWLHHSAENIFVTYDDVESMGHKTDYIKSEGLGGVMFWHLGQDDSQFTLLSTLHEQLNPDDGDTTDEDDSDLEGVVYNRKHNTYRQTSDKVIVSYFTEWGVYDRNYHVADVPFSNLTHLLFGFIAICGDNPIAVEGTRNQIDKQCADKQDYEVTLIDQYANLDRTYEGDTWREDNNGDVYNGTFGQLKKLKAERPELKILPSIGGWTLSTPFYSMAKSDAHRATFVASAVAFIKKYDFFDGLDIDWEYPVHAGADSGLGSPEDSEGYTKLMRDLRAGLDALSEETGRTYELTSAVGASPARIAALDYAAATEYMDYVFLMSYDYMGGWDNTVGHHTPLYNNRGEAEGIDTDASVQNLLTAGVPAGKLVVGSPFYGKAWTGTQNTNTEKADLFPIYGEATGVFGTGSFDYSYIYDNFTAANGYVQSYDEVAEAAYLWNADTGVFISYDSPRSVTAKANYVKEHGLGGMLSWQIDGDNGDLLNAMNDAFGNKLIYQK